MKVDKMSKSLIHGLGGLLSVSVLAGSIFFIAYPQYQESETIAETKNNLSNELIVQEAQLNQLRILDNDPDELYSELSQLQSLMPAYENVSNLQRSIVNSLDSDVDIVFFEYGDVTTYSNPDRPELTLEAFENPFDIDGNSISSAPETIETPETVDGEAPSSVLNTDDNEEEQESSTGTSLQAVPMTVEIESNSSDGISNTLDNIHQANRLMLVVKSDISYPADRDGLYSATIYLYGFINQ